MLQKLLRTIFIIGLMLVSFTFNASASEVLKQQIQTDNGMVSLGAFKGKVIWLDFWASWCLPCKQSFPWFEKMHAKYKDRGLLIIANSLDENIQDAKRFLAEQKVGFIVSYDPKAELAETFRIKAMPTAILINKEGNIHKIHSGFREEHKSQLEAEILKLIDYK